MKKTAQVWQVLVVAVVAIITQFAFKKIKVCSANDNGLALRPPMGWRSWNLFGANVNQQLIESVMEALARKEIRTMPDGSQEMVSLCDIGYCNVGLDDGWQECGSARAAPGMNYHAKDGSPIVNITRFPDMRSMVDKAHSLGLTAGWYANNCICADQCHANSEPNCEDMIRQDVDAFAQYGFDSYKLDGCGGETDLVMWNRYLNVTVKRPILIENCHWGSVPPAIPNPSVPAAQGCPWNFYRSSGDVRASYASVMQNLFTIFPLHDSKLSYPGCWAYPDMLEVGCQHGPGGPSDPGLTFEETRSHFGAWAIVSSPLTLSHDVSNKTVTDFLWPIISNKEVLEINGAYVGDSGGLYDSSPDSVNLSDAIFLGEGQSVTIPKYVYLYKPIGSKRIAVFLMNASSATAQLTADFTKVPGLECNPKCSVRDVWKHEELGFFEKSFSTTVLSHDAAFLVIQPVGGFQQHSSVHSMRWLSSW